MYYDILQGQNKIRVETFVIHVKTKNILILFAYLLEEYFSIIKKNYYNTIFNNFIFIELYIFYINVE